MMMMMMMMVKVMVMGFGLGIWMRIHNQYKYLVAISMTFGRLFYFMMRPTKKRFFQNLTPNGVKNGKWVIMENVGLGLRPRLGQGLGQFLGQGPGLGPRRK